MTGIGGTGPFGGIGPLRKKTAMRTTISTDAIINPRSHLRFGGDETTCAEGEACARPTIHSRTGSRPSDLNSRSGTRIGPSGPTLTLVLLTDATAKTGTFPSAR